VKSHL